MPGLETPSSLPQVSAGEVSNGLAFPATTYALLGRSGLYLTVVICFMSVTSCGAGEMVAVSSLITFSIFRVIKPDVSQLLLAASRLEDHHTPSEPER
jgi:Na+/proline symporter